MRMAADHRASATAGMMPTTRIGALVPVLMSRNGAAVRVRPRPRSPRAHRRRLRHASGGCQFGVGNHAAKHWKPRTVVAADDVDTASTDAERASAAGRRDVATVPDGRERRTRSDGHRFDARTVRSRSSSARCACRPRVGPASAGSTSTIIRRRDEIRIGRGPDRAHQNSPPDEQEQRQRDCPMTVHCRSDAPPAGAVSPKSRLRSAASARPGRARPAWHRRQRGEETEREK